MPIYRRDIKTKLLLLRLLFISVVVLCIYLFNRGLSDYSYVLAFLLALGAIVPVTGLKVERVSFTIKQYYCYGLIPRSWTFLKGDNISIEPFDVELSDAGYQMTDTVWDLLVALYPTSTVTIKQFVIKHKESNSDATQIKMKLTEQEYKLIQQSFL